MHALCNYVITCKKVIHCPWRYMG